MKHLLIVITLLGLLGTSAMANIIVRPPAVPVPHHYPYPMPPRYPYPVPPVYVPPVYVQPAYVYTCWVRNPYNGLSFYGVGYDIFTATQRAHLACNSTGLACVYIGCQ